MKKTLATLATIIALSCTNQTPTITPTPTSTQMLEKNLVGLNLQETNGLYTLIAAYDTDQDMTPDVFELYGAVLNGNWVYLSPEPLDIIHSYELLELKYR